jgi:hypothetical protein
MSFLDTSKKDDLAPPTIQAKNEKAESPTGSKSPLHPFSAFAKEV